MNTSILEQELAPLDAQIEQARQKKEALEAELRAIEAELNAFSADRERFDALRDVCDALDKLRELKADGLFWEGIPEAEDPAGHMGKARESIARFEEKISGVLAKQQSLQERVNRGLEELDFLDEEVRNAYDREERRQEEFAIERDISSIPYRAMVMPWTKEAESEKRFRRAVIMALFISFVFGGLILLIKVPIPDRAATVMEIPERLVQLVKKEPPVPAPEKEIKQAKKEPQEKKEREPQAGKPEPDEPAKEARAAEKPKEVAANDSGSSAARMKAEGAGVLKFKNDFKDLMKETPVARLGTEARLDNKSLQAQGQAVAQRSLVAMQAKGGSSGGIGGASVSRNVGSGNAARLGGGSGVGFARVESAIAGLGESSRPISDGLSLGRTDEEVQIVFDRYKAALYRIYNQELRKDPTLRGKILMRISIEPDGTVSLCKVESTDLASPVLVENIVERIKKFNFGPKEGVQKMTILYPIDFLPAG